MHAGDLDRPAGRCSRCCRANKVDKSATWWSAASPGDAGALPVLADEALPFDEVTPEQLARTRAGGRA